MTEKANFYYKLFINWTNQKIKSTFIKNNLFDFKHIWPFDKTMMRSSQPMVLFATPGMLHGGLSMQVFKEWCHDERNTLIIPGYCVAGTLGNKLLSGIKTIHLDKKTYEINMQIKNMSFSAHADAKGIINLVKQAEPRNVVLVHGEKKKMEILCDIIKEQLGLPCYYPANFERLKIETVPESFPMTVTSKASENMSSEAGIIDQFSLKGLMIFNENTNKIDVVHHSEIDAEIKNIISMIEEGRKIDCCMSVDRGYIQKLSDGQVAAINLKYRDRDNGDRAFINDLYSRLYEEIQSKDYAWRIGMSFEFLKSRMVIERAEDKLLITYINEEEEDKKKSLNNELERIVSDVQKWR
eukprot:TRINITY_DN997_c0_g1_i4.p2 TRINITY_DN997_c0_g1~~TRINITY_DN997_c0_g1_i4.p2  ORF type:complete len:353 (+),score=104.03 TRINITY_DN997_c0_g1_i4:883-1941(+)